MQRMSLYLDDDTKSKIETLSKSLKRSMNNLLVYLVNDYYDKECNKKETFLKEWKPIDNVNLSGVKNIRDFIYDDK